MGRPGRSIAKLTLSDTRRESGTAQRVYQALSDVDDFHDADGTTSLSNERAAALRFLRQAAREVGGAEVLDVAELTVARAVDEWVAVAGSRASERLGQECAINTGCALSRMRTRISGVPSSPKQREP
jgi:hypothetical protein